MLMYVVWYFVVYGSIGLASANLAAMLLRLVALVLLFAYFSKVHNLKVLRMI